MNEWIPLFVAMLAFCSMAGITFVAGQYYLRAVHLTRRTPVAHGERRYDLQKQQAPLQASSLDTSMRSALESMQLHAVNFD